MDIIEQKGIFISPKDQEKLEKFIKNNCSKYYMINFLRITSGNVDDAILLYYLDENLRAIILKYILRLEVQMKKDFINYVYKETNDDSFWNNKKYYNQQFTSIKKQNLKSSFDIAIKEVKERMLTMHYSSSSDRNQQAFYTMSLGAFIKFYSGMYFRYHHDFTEKYAYKDSHSVNILKHYLDSIRIIRNRCCHSNHMISVKLKNSLIFKTSLLDGFVGDQYSEFEKTIYFIYTRLENKGEFKDDIINLLENSESCWKPYCGKHILPSSFLEDLKLW